MKLFNDVSCYPSYLYFHPNNLVEIIVEDFTESLQSLKWKLSVEKVQMIKWNIETIGDYNFIVIVGDYNLWW